MAVVELDPVKGVKVVPIVIRLETLESFVQLALNIELSSQYKLLY